MFKSPKTTDKPESQIFKTQLLFILDLLPSIQLKSLGELCGLVSEKGPTSEDLNRTVDLLAGLGDERPETGELFCSVLDPTRVRTSSMTFC